MTYQVHINHAIKYYILNTDNKIGDKGGKAIAEALKKNTSLTKLDLRLTQQQQHFPFPHSQITENKIGADGGKAIGEGLKTNTSLTKLDLNAT